MEELTYTGPSGPRVVNPSLEFLERIIFHEKGKHWRGGSGDSGLAIEVAVGKRGSRVVTREPSLMFFLVPRHGFFFNYFAPDQEKVSNWVPFAGGECRPWVKHYIGGDTFFAPRACFVSRPFAWEVVREFVRTRKRSRAVPWVDRFKLEFPFPPGGDPVPRKADRT